MNLFRAILLAGKPIEEMPLYQVSAGRTIRGGRVGRCVGRICNMDSDKIQLQFDDGEIVWFDMKDVTEVFDG